MRGDLKLKTLVVKYLIEYNLDKNKEESVYIWVLSFTECTVMKLVV